MDSLTYRYLEELDRQRAAMDLFDHQTKKESETMEERRWDSKDSTMLDAKTCQECSCKVKEGMLISDDTDHIITTRFLCFTCWGEGPTKRDDKLIKAGPGSTRKDDELSERLDTAYANLPSSVKGKCPKCSSTEATCFECLLEERAIETAKRTGYAGLKSGKISDLEGGTLFVYNDFDWIRACKSIIAIQAVRVKDGLVATFNHDDKFDKVVWMPSDQNHPFRRPGMFDDQTDESSFEKPCLEGILASIEKEIASHRECIDGLVIAYRKTSDDRHCLEAGLESVEVSVKSLVVSVDAQQGFVGDHERQLYILNKHFVMLKEKGLFDDQTNAHCGEPEKTPSEMFDDQTNPVQGTVKFPGAEAEIETVDGFTGAPFDPRTDEDIKSGVEALIGTPFDPREGMNIWALEQIGIVFSPALKKAMEIMGTKNPDSKSFSTAERFDILSASIDALEESVSDLEESRDALRLVVAKDRGRNRKDISELRGGLVDALEAIETVSTALLNADKEGLVGGVRAVVRDFLLRRFTVLGES
jgi:hypothetical protein